MHILHIVASPHIYKRLKYFFLILRLAMSLAIKINSDGVYTNGDEVKGTVFMQVKEGVETKGVTIELFGKAYSRNWQATGQGYYSWGYKHKLILKTQVLFPPKEVADLSSASQFTLAPGHYGYDFHFRFPEEYYQCLCKARKSTFHYGGYTRYGPLGVVLLPPSFSYKEGMDNYCNVQYELIARIHKPVMKFDVKESILLQFCPRNDCMSFSYRQLCERKHELKLDKESKMKKVKFSLDDSDQPTSLLLRIVNRNKKVVPMSFMVEFLPGNQRPTELGNCSRFICPSAKLSRFIELSILVHTSAKELQQAFSNENKKTDTSSREWKVLLSHIKIKLVLNLRWIGATETRLHEKFLILDKPLAREFSVDHFDSSNEGLSLPLDPELWDCSIPDITGLSFYTCNIRRDFRLHVTVTLSSWELPDKETTIKVQCPIVLINPESPTPAYTTIAPPEYHKSHHDELVDS